MEHEYKDVYPLVSPEAMAAMIYAVHTSPQFELDDLSHVVLKGTETRVGYFGDESFELVDPQNKSLEAYHSDLKAICDSAIADLPD